MTDIGVYRITNINTQKVYIGSSARLKHRIYCHKWDLKKQKHHSFLLQRSWNKHGEDAFIFEIMEHCERDKLPAREQYWMDKYDCANPEKGYNRSPTAGTTAGCVKTPETRAKISASKKGKVAWNKGLKGAQKWADDDPRRAKPPAQGRKRTAAEKQAISDAKKGVPCHPNSRAATSAARLGKPGHINQKNRLKELWADPDWRAAVIEKRRVAREAKHAIVTNN